MFHRLLARYQDYFEDVHPRLKASPLEVSCLLHKVWKNRFEGHDIPFFPPSFIFIFVSDEVENINHPVLQVNLQHHPMLVANHNEKDLNKSENNSRLNGEHLNEFYIDAKS